MSGDDVYIDKLERAAKPFCLEIPKCYGDHQPLEHGMAEPFPTVGDCRKLVAAFNTAEAEEKSDEL